MSPNLGFKKDQYNLTWTVDSFLPIEEYRILYRVNLVSRKTIYYFLPAFYFLKLYQIIVHLVKQQFYYSHLIMQLRRTDLAEKQRTKEIAIKALDFSILNPQNGQISSLKYQTQAIKVHTITK